MITICNYNNNCKNIAIFLGLIWFGPVWFYILLDYYLNLLSVKTGFNSSILVDYTLAIIQLKIELEQVVNHL